MPKVSVIIPTYNYARFLAESLDSVLGQDYKDFEVIVVDDGSTDGTKAVLASYGDRVRWVTCQHCGSAAARNVGIALAGGELIAFQDADDIWLPGSLSSRVEMMERHPELGMVFGDVIVMKDGAILFPSFLRECKRFHSLEKVREDGQCTVFGRSVFPDLLHERFVTTPTVLIRRSCLDSEGMWDPSVQDQEDYEFQIRMARRFKLGYVDKPLAICRLHGANITCCRTRTQHARRLAVILRYRNDPALSDVQRKALRHRLSDLYMESAWYLRTIGDLKAASQHYRLAWINNRRNYKPLVRYLSITLRAAFETSRRETHPEVIA